MAIDYEALLRKVSVAARAATRKDLNLLVLVALTLKPEEKDHINKLADQIEAIERSRDPRALTEFLANGR